MKHMEKRKVNIELNDYPFNIKMDEKGITKDKLIQIVNMCMDEYVSFKIDIGSLDTVHDDNLIISYGAPSKTCTKYTVEEIIELLKGTKNKDWNVSSIDLQSIDNNSSVR